MTTAKDMIEMLRRHYLPESREPGGIFAPEIQAPNSTRRADLIWQGCTAAGGHELVGHEVKVTRQDLLVELQDPTKSDPWQRYCDRWWLVLPSMELARGLELPVTWGVMTPPSGRRTRSMTVEVAAPALKPVEQSPALKTLATWLHWRLYRSENECRQTREYLRAAQDQAEKVRDEMERIGFRRSPDYQAAERIVKGLGGAYGEEIGQWPNHVNVDDVVAALKDLAATRRERDRAARTLDDIKQQLSGMQNRINTVIGKAAA